LIPSSVGGKPGKYTGDWSDEITHKSAKDLWKHRTRAFNLARGIWGRCQQQVDSEVALVGVFTEVKAENGTSGRRNSIHRKHGEDKKESEKMRFGAQEGE
jgi:hypothetical protein